MKKGIYQAETIDGLWSDYRGNLVIELETKKTFLLDLSSFDKDTKFICGRVLSAFARSEILYSQI